MSLLSVRQLNAYWTLGWALVKHLLSRPFVGRRLPGPWLGQLRAESIAAVPPRAWGYFEGATRCLGCGLCDLAGVERESPATWVLGMGRQPADAPLALEQTERLTAMAADIARICPARVPIEELVGLIEDNARLLREP